jgi:hypothetical protein
MHTPEKGKFEGEWKNVFDGAELTPSNSVWNAIDAKLSQAGSANTGFENGWEKAFRGAEMAPSEDVWKAIDVALVQAENTSIKRRVVLYQRIAAASVGIMIMFGAYSWVNFNRSSGDFISEAKNTAKEEVANQPGASSGSKDRSLSDESSASSGSNPGSNQNSSIENTPVAAQTSDESAKIQNVARISGTTKTKSGNDQGSSVPSLNSQTTQQILSALPVIANNQSDYVGSDFNAPLVAEKGPSNPNYNFNQGPISKVETVALSSLADFFGPNDYSIAYRLADAIPAVAVKRKSVLNTENQWAAVGFSAGSYFPGIGGGEVTESLNSIRAAQVSSGFADFKNTPTTTKEERIKSGTSTAMAVSGGTRLAKRWVLQGGVSYLNQSSTTESEVVSVAQANQVADDKSGYTLESTNTVTYGELQEINSNFKFISVPLQIGYMVLDDKVGLQINGGIAPDFLLNNTVYNEATQVQTSNSASDSGNLNTVSVSGIGGFEVSYRFLNHYRLSLVPGVKYSLTPVYSDNSLASAKPFVADIGLRFRYIF